jgi:hypothetical protein
LGAEVFTFQDHGMLRCPAGAQLWLSELRQEHAFTQRAIYVAPREDGLRCPLREQCLGRDAKGNRARRVSAVRRLVPVPPSVASQTGVTAAMGWVDVAGRALRRTWITHWRRQYVEILPLAEIPETPSPPPRPPRAIRSHHRWRWHDRLAWNAGWGPPPLRITVAGVPAFLTMNERSSVVSYKRGSPIAVSCLLFLFSLTCFGEPQAASPSFLLGTEFPACGDVFSPAAH